MTRREAREQILALLFETAFKSGDSPETIYSLAMEIREIEDSDYIRETYFGTIEQLPFIDSKIEEFSRGWSSDRISPVSRAIMRLAVYEIYFREDVPDSAAVNEAVELVKKYDDEEKVRKFVNGILNSVMKAKSVGENA